MAFPKVAAWTLRAVLLLVAVWFGSALNGTEGASRYLPLIPILLIGMLPQVSSRIWKVQQRLRDPSRDATRMTTIAIGALTCIYLYANAVYIDRELHPRMHDEFMHLLQIRMMAHGALWLPSHPLADFFESFHIFVKPVYASMYFPGGSLFYLPTIWFGLDPWLMPLLTVSAIVAITYWVVRELIDGEAGILAAMWMIALAPFRMTAFMVMSHQVMLILGLLAFVAWIRWRRTMHMGWVAVIGALGGWAAITRPVDALCYLVPIGIAMFVRLVREPRDGVEVARVSRIALTAGLLVVSAAPFLSLQLVLNHGLTGSWSTMPWDEYVRINQPQFGYLESTFDPTVRPQTALLQKVEYYDTGVVPLIRNRAELGHAKIWWREKLSVFVGATLPAAPLLVPLFLGFTGLTTARRWTLLAALLLFVLLYTPYAHLLPQYSNLVVPAIAMLAMLGLRDVEQWFPRHRATVATLLFLSTTYALIIALPQTKSNNEAEAMDWPTMRAVHYALPDAVDAPAIVLFRYTPGYATPHEEPVYNVTTAWPDDAAIIRAHDLGDRNAELFAYYAQRQPDRNVYRFDRATGQLTFLGRARDLAPTSGSPLK
ncbi:MAG TPA: hypothetical protein VGN72_09090 [Tepidisphaeraceae bacterium]|nr:hypothetical protein [Tepidisphaeraceae bacterium]